jgi:hypothetical protein
MFTAKRWWFTALVLGAVMMGAGCATGGGQYAASSEEGSNQGGISYQSRVDAIGQIKGARR